MSFLRFLRRNKQCDERMDAFRLDSGNWLTLAGLSVFAASWLARLREVRWRNHMDVRRPTEKQILLLDEMLTCALSEIRSLAMAGNAEQAAALADAFHNLPVVMHSEQFSFVHFRQDLDRYVRSYPFSEGKSTYDYLEMYQRVLLSTEF